MKLAIFRDRLPSSEENVFGRAPGQRFVVLLNRPSPIADECLMALRKLRPAVRRAAQLASRDR